MGQRGTEHPLIEGVAGEGVAEQLSSIISVGNRSSLFIEFLPSPHASFPIRIFLDANPFHLELRRRPQAVHPRDVQNGSTYIVYHSREDSRNENPPTEIPEDRH